MDELKDPNYINKPITLGKKGFEILNILWYSERKRNKKNQKTNKRRNELRSENGKKTKRGSKGKKHNNNDYLRDFSELKEKIGDDIFKLTVTGNIIGLFSLYGVELKETYNLYRGLCPFHKENTPSFTLGKGKGVARCFGCGKGYELMSMTFKLKFGENTTKKRRRFEELKKDVDKFINLEPITKFKSDHVKKKGTYKYPNDDESENLSDLDGLPF